MTAAEVVMLLGLQPHPEGGWYRETFVDPNSTGRAHSTLIYFLLAADNPSYWHRIDSAEVWHWYAGAALELRIETITHRLGNDLAAGERPQAVVPPRAWQAARTLGDWTLVGCTVAPGFEFSAFELAPPGFEP